MRAYDPIQSPAPRTPYGGDIVALLKAIAVPKAWFVPERGASVDNGAVTMVEEDASGILRVFDRLGSTARLYAPSVSGTRPSLGAARWNGYIPLRFGGTTDYRYRMDNLVPDLSGTFTIVLPFEYEFDVATGKPLVPQQFLVGRQTSASDRCNIEKPANAQVIRANFGAKTAQLFLPKNRCLLVLIYNATTKTLKFCVNKVWADDLDVTGETSGTAAGFALGALNTNGAAPLAGWTGPLFFAAADLRDDPAYALHFTALQTYCRLLFGLPI